MSAQQPTPHAVNWFEIPVIDLPRAQAFYERILDKALRREAMGEQTLAVFPYQDPGVGGCLMQASGTQTPVNGGTMVYLNAQPSLNAVLARVESAGGSVVQPRVDLPGDMGCYAHVIDTEGNRIGLHALA